MSALDRFWELLDAVPVPPDAEFLYGPSGAGPLRRANLERYLSLVADARVMLVAEAPGHRGMSVTGVPFTSIRELDRLPGMLMPAGGPEWEQSSRVVWAALADWPGPLPVSWPIYPHHPHESGRPDSNRTPRPAEVRAGAPVALELMRALGVETVVAVGRKAQGALALAGVEAAEVRHPAQGGARQFTEQLAAIGAALGG